jgi:hypothetical protein
MQLISLSVRRTMVSQGSDLELGIPFFVFSVHMRLLSPLAVFSSLHLKLDNPRSLPCVLANGENW